MTVGGNVMFRYFWLERTDLPEGVGFGAFTLQHFAALAACAAGIVILCLWFYHLDSRKTASGFLRQEKALRVIAMLMLAGNIGRDIMLIAVGRMSLGYLPLHLCSFSIFVYLFYAFLPEHTPRMHAFRGAIAEISYVLLAPGSLCALIFPDWTMYPLANFLCIHSFVWHAVLAAFPIMLRLSGRCHPTIRHLWYPFAFLAAIVPPIGLFDYLTGMNYLFLAWPVPGTPLETCKELLGSFWRVGYAALVFLVILAIYLLIELVHAIRRFAGVRCR